MSIFKRLQKIISAEIDSRMNSSANRERAGESFTSSHQSQAGQASEENSQHPLFTEKELQYFANLEIEPGSNFEEIKTAYKTLLRKYHPDKYHNDDRAKYAQEISQKLNEAYAYFEKKYKEST